MFAGGPLVGANIFQTTVTRALYGELFVHTGLVVCWLCGGTRLLSYGCYTLNWLDISSNQIYVDLETLGPLVEPSLCSDTTARALGFLNPRRSSDSMSNLYLVSDQHAPATLYVLKKKKNIIYIYIYGGFFKLKHKGYTVQSLAADYSRLTIHVVY